MLMRKPEYAFLGDLPKAEYDKLRKVDSWYQLASIYIIHLTVAGLPASLLEL